MKKLLANLKDKIASAKTKVSRSRAEQTLTGIKIQLEKVREKAKDKQGLLAIPSKVLNVNNRPLIQRWYSILLYSSICIFCGRILGMVLTLPQAEPPTQKSHFRGHVSSVSRPVVMSIKTANLFKTIDRAIEGKKKQSKIPEICQQSSRASSLPIDLINTTVLQDSVKSIASVQLRSDRELKDVRQGEKIGTMARVDRIDRLEIIIKNLQTKQCEKIANRAIEDERNNKNPVEIMTPSQESNFKEKELAKKASQVKQEGNKFVIPKKLVNDLMSDMGKILTQARAVPITNPDGTMSFRIVDIAPGSIYTHLGIKDNDIIHSINGKKIKNVNEIMTLFSRMKTITSMNLGVERDGSELNRGYTIQ